MTLLMLNVAISCKTSPASSNIGKQLRVWRILDHVAAEVGA
jgi:hypothetical protein